MTDLDARYGRSKKPRPRWFWPVISIVGISLAVAWTAWAASSQDRPWQAQVFAYDVVDDETTTITLRVYRKEPVELLCTVFAQAEDKVYVGEKDVTIPADAPDPALVTVEIRTQYRAVTADVRNCEVV